MGARKTKRKGRSYTNETTDPIQTWIIKKTRSIRVFFLSLFHPRFSNKNQSNATKTRKASHVAGPFLF